MCLSVFFPATHSTLCFFGQQRLPNNLWRGSLLLCAAISWAVFLRWLMEPTKWVTEEQLSNLTCALLSPLLVFTLIQRSKVCFTSFSCKIKILYLPLYSMQLSDFTWMVALISCSTPTLILFHLFTFSHRVIFHPQIIIIVRWANVSPISIQRNRKCCFPWFSTTHEKRWWFNLSRPNICLPASSTRQFYYLV